VARVDRTATRLLILGVLMAALLGLVGLLLTAEGALLLLPLPRTVQQRAWRLLALTAVTTGLISGGVGGGYFALADLWGGTASVSQSVFAFFEGGVLFGAAGLILGALVGAVVAMDYRRRNASTRDAAGWLERI
jgi:hypothetical protein